MRLLAVSGKIFRCAYAHLVKECFLFCTGEALQKVQRTEFFARKFEIKAECRIEHSVIFCGGAGDHRIVMAGAVARSLCEGDVIICGADAVSKSYPAFFDDFASLKGESYEI